TAPAPRRQGHGHRCVPRRGAVPRTPAGVRGRRPDRRAWFPRGRRAWRDGRTGRRSRQRRAPSSSGHRRGPCVARSRRLNGGGRMQQTLDLGVIGNGSFGALIDREARVVWSCLPAFDGDPAFCALLSPRQHEGGDLAVELEDFERSEQHYVTNTALLRTVLHDRHGGAVEVLDFAPRWKQNGRIYRPVSIIRRITPLAGSPRVRVRAR